MKRVQMTKSRTETSDGSKTTYMAGHFYLLPDDVADAFVAADDATEPEGAEQQSAPGTGAAPGHEE